METVLGIDNIIFIAILVGKLPPQQRDKARTFGLMLALATRLGLLFSLSWLMSLTEPLFSAFEQPFSGRDIVLILGGVFLIGKSTLEIHSKLEDGKTEHHTPNLKGGFIGALIQIALIDIIFSLDSVITAVGMSNQISIMVVAMVASMIIMLLLAKSISNFVDRNPTIKVLALSFLIMIGVMLVAEGFGTHISKGYIYFAMAFSCGVEMINLKVRQKT